MNEPTTQIDQPPELPASLAHLSLQDLIPLIKDAAKRADICRDTTLRYATYALGWARVCGGYLCHIKDNGLYGTHGEWEKWLANTFDLKERQLQKYMQVWREWDDIQEAARQKRIENADFTVLTIDHATTWKKWTATETQEPEPTIKLHTPEKKPRRSHVGTFGHTTTPSSNKQTSIIPKNEHKWDFTDEEDEVTANLTLLQPGKFSLRFEAILNVYDIQLTRQQVNELQAAITKAIAMDDHAS